AVRPETPGPEHGDGAVVAALRHLPARQRAELGSMAVVTNAGQAGITPAGDTPYGRLAQVSDPTGALFKLAANP
ncbi:MAG: hypothetical protein ACYCZM_14845, partial [Acidimicrobiales bacterium]